MDQDLIGYDGCILIEEDLVEGHGGDLSNEYPPESVGNRNIYSLNIKLDALFGIAFDVDAELTLEVLAIEGLLLGEELVGGGNSLLVKLEDAFGLLLAGFFHASTTIMEFWRSILFRSTGKESQESA